MPIHPSVCLSTSKWLLTCYVCSNATKSKLPSSHPSLVCLGHPRVRLVGSIQSSFNNYRQRYNYYDSCQQVSVLFASRFSLLVCCCLPQNVVVSIDWLVAALFWLPTKSDLRSSFSAKFLGTERRLQWKIKWYNLTGESNWRTQN